MLGSMSRWNDRYGTDPLASRPPVRRYREVEGTRGLIIEDAATEYCGAVVGFEKSDSGLLVRLEDRHGRVRVFPTKPGLLLLEGEPIHLVRPVDHNSPIVAPASRHTRSAPALLGLPVSGWKVNTMPSLSNRYGDTISHKKALSSKNWRGWTISRSG